MRALTVYRPWDVALLNGKNVENRPVKPPVQLLGQRFALHAGLTYDYAGARFIKEQLRRHELPTTQPGVIFATTELVGWIEKGTDACARAGVEVLASSPELLEHAGSPWFFGPYGLILRDTRALTRPVGARGMQGWWPVPSDVEQRVLALEKWTA